MTRILAFISVCFILHNKFHIAIKRGDAASILGTLPNGDRDRLA